MQHSHSNFLTKTHDAIKRIIKHMKPKIMTFNKQSNAGAREARDSPSTPPSCNPAYKIEHGDEHDGMANRHEYIYLY